MTAPLGRVARDLDELAAGLGGGLAAVDPGPGAFGADLPGRLGVLGRDLHARWSAEVGERARTVDALAARLTDTAATLRTAGGGYAGAEDDSARRSGEVGGA
ncbi:hypothetical protein [Asanoa siamensis]|uniref:Excreted virulence factor EspC (Type VII ESX diderm) n=1 Tax=Asanoa siamensis TaxID=926357 RepID=A0ABQ4CS23_9ACTN|nr:hypothetical protein [Asanoa siamensis]GIF74090.1 hypothetical protein Asi02nite_36080 [Asanoa siamensis]